MSVIAMRGSPRFARRNVDVFTTGYVAKLLCVSARKVALWCNSGELPHYRISAIGRDDGGDRRITLASLRAFAKARGIPLPLPSPTQVLTVGLSLAVPDAVPLSSLLDLGLSLDRAAIRHVVVLDLGAVGRGDGMAAARRLRSEFPEMRLIAVAGEDETRALELREAGFDTVLLSPVAPVTLLRAVESAIKEGD